MKKFLLFASLIAVMGEASSVYASSAVNYFCGPTSDTPRDGISYVVTEGNGVILTKYTVENGLTSTTEVSLREVSGTAGEVITYAGQSGSEAIIYQSNAWSNSNGNIHILKVGDAVAIRCHQ